jgi:hypothetical protein
VAEVCKAELGPDLSVLGAEESVFAATRLTARCYITNNVQLHYTPPVALSSIPDMRLDLRFDLGSRVVELHFKTAASHALLWLVVFLIFWLFKAGHITYHRLRIKYLRKRFKDKYFKDLVEIQEESLRRYKYQPVQGPGSKQIRLLELLSNGLVRIHTSSLAGPDIPQYEALSYCWGNTTEMYRVDVLVGDEAGDEHVEPLWVSHGLRLALERLTIKDCGRVLWVDAICINQTDLSEKSWQVSMMTDIYKNASRVVVYLDIPGGFENQTGDIIPRLVQTKQVVNASSYSKISWDDFGSHKELQKMTKAPWNSDVETASLYLFENSWFWRVWIIQEISLARDALVICEGWELPWKSLSDAYEWIGKSIHWKHLGGNTRLSLLEISRANATREDLATLLLRHRGTLASDPRDHVFALVGLAQDGDQLTVDYDMSPSDIFVQTAKHILLTKKNLGFLSAAGMSQRTEVKLPSWVPDMRTKAFQKPFPNNYSHSVSETSATCFDNHLSLKCCKVGSVTMVGESAPELPRDPSSRSFVDVKVYSTLFNWRQSSKAYSADFYAMGCVTQAGLVWPCMSGSKCHAEYKEGNPNCFEIQLWFHFLASSLPVPQSFSLVWDAVYVMSMFLLIFLVLYYWLRGKSYMRILFDDVCFGRRLIGTDHGYVGLAPFDTKIGDEIFLLEDISMLIIVRNHRGRSMLVGEGYLGSYMHNSADDCRNGRLSYSVEPSRNLNCQV